MVVKTYRGLLADGGQDHIRLSTIKGKVGYKIIKYQIMPHAVGDNNDQEHVVVIWNKERTTAQMANTTTSRPNFTNSDLLAAAININDVSSSLNYAESVIFDNKVFNQDIFISHRDIAAGAQACNYYIELEVIPLTDQGAEYTTLKDIRTQLSIS